MRALLLIMLFACAKPAGGPLSHTFDNTRLAGVPLEQKQAVVQAQQAHEQALLARTNASATYADSEIELDTAELQARKSIVTSHVVAARQPGAELAKPSAEAAAIGRRAAGAKVAFMKARRAWLGKLASSSLHAVYATQARLELERVRVAVANRILAADATAAFEKQAEGRTQAARVAADETEAERKTAEARLAEWAELEQQYLQASGVKGPLESAHFAAEWKTYAAAPMPPSEPEAPPAPAGDTKPAEPPSPQT